MREIFSGLLCALLWATETAGSPTSLSRERRETDKGGNRCLLVPMVFGFIIVSLFF